MGDMTREANSQDVIDLKKENEHLKQPVAEIVLKNRVLSRELKSYLEKKGITHTRGAPYHPMTQGKIERYYPSMINIVKRHNYYFTWELKQKSQGS